MNRALKITYRWRRADDGGPVVEGHEKALEEEAEEYIRKQDGQGYTSGELDAHVKMTADDPADGVHYRGWWDLDRIDEEPERRIVKKIRQTGFQRMILPKAPMDRALELAESIAARQYLQILALRDCGHVTYQEVVGVTKHLTKHFDLPEDVRAEVVRIRKERWGTE